jgi:hypothetical protein
MRTTFNNTRRTNSKSKNITTILEQYKIQYQLLISLEDCLLKIHSLHVTLITASIGYFTSLIMKNLSKLKENQHTLSTILLYTSVICFIITCSWISSWRVYEKKKLICEKVLDEIEGKLPSAIHISKEKYKTKIKAPWFPNEGIGIIPFWLFFTLIVFVIAFALAA